MIESFKGEYSWLSNFQFFEKPLVYQGISYETSEHFYQAMKTKDPTLRKQIAAHPLKGLKKFANTIDLREDWVTLKIEVMLYTTRYKYSQHNPTLRSRLISTGNEEIQEGNWWGDKFWGVCLKTGEGMNRLGHTIMLVRDEIGGKSNG